MTMERMKLAKGFFDTETNLEYSAGDMYPRYVEPTAERIAFLKDAGVFEPTEEEFAQMSAVPTDKWLKQIQQMKKLNKVMFNG